MEPVRILWSGLTGKTGRAALKVARERDDVKIVSGISRSNMSNIAAIGDTSIEGIKWLRYGELEFPFYKARDADVIVDFSHPQQLGKVLTLAVMLEKPLIIGTSGLSDVQLMDLKRYGHIIPIFRGGNFLFNVKKFVDEAVNLAINTPENLTLYESFYEGKRLPSEASKVIKKRVNEATGKTIGVSSSARLSRSELVCDWKIGDLHCRTVGFSELASNILDITRVMAEKPAKSDGFYDLDQIWSDLISWML